MPEADVERRRPQHLASRSVGYLNEEHAHYRPCALAVEHSVSLQGGCGSWSVRALHPAVASCRVVVSCASASSAVVSESSA